MRVTTRFFRLLLCASLVAVSLNCAGARAAEKPRVIVLTDISNEPDDEESLVRFLVYSNEYDVEGLVATTSTWLKKGPREDLIHRDIAAYAQVRDNPVSYTHLDVYKRQPFAPSSILC